MEIIILGSGTMNISKKRGSAAYLVKIKNDYLLLDCGSGTMKKMADIGFDYQKISYIVISHSHPDHITDLMALIHPQKFIPRKKTLHLIGPQDIKNKWKKLKEIMWSEPREIPTFLKIYPAKKSVLKFKNFTIKTFPIQHTPLLPYQKFPGIITKIIHRDKILIYSGDWCNKVFNQDFIDFFKNADLLIAEAGKKIGQQAGGHLNPEEVGLLSGKAQIKKVILTHINDSFKQTEKQMIATCRKYYQGPITVAKDLMKIKL